MDHNIIYMYLNMHWDCITLSIHVSCTIITVNIYPQDAFKHTHYVWYVCVCVVTSRLKWSGNQFAWCLINLVQATICIIKAEDWTQDTWASKQASIEAQMVKPLSAVCGKYDYIWLHNQVPVSEKIGPHTDQKREINFVWPYSRLLTSIHKTNPNTRYSCM